MNYISIQFLAGLTLLPPLYWLVLRAPSRNQVLALLSAVTVGYFYPASAVLLMVVGAASYLGLTYLTGGLRYAVMAVPVLTLVLSRFPTSLLPTSEWTVATVGVSFFTLKIIHVVVDVASGQLQKPTLFSFLFYLFYFPAFTAGPIVRFGEFAEGMERTDGPDIAQVREGLRRIALGLGRKLFIVLPVFSQSEYILGTGDVDSSLALWGAVFAYSLYIYWDFAGYTDIAIGTSLLFNYRLPENFRAPYLKQNLSLFWQHWHISLTRWLQAYLFSPLSRFLMLRQTQWPTWVVSGIAQVTTMALCGLWHGSTWSFLVWGLYHGFGLFLHNRFKALVQGNRSLHFLKSRPDRPWLKVVYTGVTFVFVSVGWLFFCAPLDQAVANLRMLVGL